MAAAEDNEAARRHCAPPAPPKESVAAGEELVAFGFRRGYPILRGVRGAAGKRAAGRLKRHMQQADLLLT